MLEEQIQQRFAPAEHYGKQQIRVDMLEAGFHKRTREHRQRRPVDLTRDLHGQVAFEKRGGVFRLGENGFEKPVVCVRGGGFRGSYGVIHNLRIRLGAASDKPLSWFEIFFSGWLRTS